MSGMVALAAAVLWEVLYKAVVIVHIANAAKERLNDKSIYEDIFIYLLTNITVFETMNKGRRPAISISSAAPSAITKLKIYGDIVRYTSQ